MQRNTKRLYVHHFRVTDLGQLDEQFAGWLGEAYQVGTGVYLEPRYSKAADIRG